MNASRMTRNIIWAMISLIVTGLTAFIITYVTVDTNRNAGEIINVSGRQRMLSQRIAFLAVELSESKNYTPAALARLSKEMEEATNLLESSHNFLIEQIFSRKDEIFYFDDPFNVDIRVKSYIAAARAINGLARQRLTVDERYIQYIAENRLDILKDLDRIVAQYEKDYESIVNTLIRYQSIVLFVTLFVIFVLHRKVFVPMVQEVLKAQAVTQSLFSTQKKFLNIMKDELQTPLKGVTSATKSLKEAYISSEHRRLYNTLEHSASRLETILSDIINVIELSSGQTTANQDAFNISQIVDYVIKQRRESINVKGLELVVLNENPNTVVIGDKIRFIQLLRALIDNAVKYTDEGNVIVKWLSNSDASGVSILVSDTGRGIPAEDLERIYERFYQVENINPEERSGTGLGLAIVKYTTSLLEGYINVISRVGQGTTFTVDLPFKVAVGDNAQDTEKNVARIAPPQNAKTSDFIDLKVIKSLKSINQLSDRVDYYLEDIDKYIENLQRSV